MIKITVDDNGNILSSEKVSSKVIYLDRDFDEWVMFEWGSYIKFADSKSWQNRILEQTKWTHK